MNQQKAFWWKVGYIVAIAVLLVPLHILSQPETSRSPGGVLAKLRKEYDLSEANLGEVDVSAETVKLATLGLRGIAVDILWNKAAEYKEKEDWDGFGAARTQIAYLQPHFYNVWDFQAHNLTYNTSVEFDDYHARFYWVMEGIKFLKLGRKENRHEPRITGRIGWFIGQKIGKADEHRQYRRLFKEDDEFHKEDDPTRPRSQRDNWLVSAVKYKQGEEQVRNGDQLHTTPRFYYDQPMMSLINYAEAIEGDDTAGETPKFGEVAKYAWQNAGREKDAFGARELLAADNITKVRLNEYEDLVENEKHLEEQLEKLMPGEFAKLVQAERSKQSDSDHVALTLPFDQRSETQRVIGIQWWNEVAERTSDDRRPKARKLTAELNKTESAAREIRMSREIVNFDYWKTRCEAEPTDDALAARQLMYQAGQEQMEARPLNAKKLYEESFDAWRKVLNRWKVLHEDTLMAEDLSDVVEKYRDVLQQLAGKDAQFPKPFVLQDMLDLNDRTNPRPKVPVKRSAVGETGGVPSTTPVEATPAASAPAATNPISSQPDATKPAADSPKPAPGSTPAKPK